MFYWRHACVLRTYGVLASAIAACASPCTSIRLREIYEFGHACVLRTYGALASAIAACASPCASIRLREIYEFGHACVLRTYGVFPNQPVKKNGEMVRNKVSKFSYTFLWTKIIIKYILSTMYREKCNSGCEVMHSLIKIIHSIE